MAIRLCTYNVEYFNRLFHAGSDDLKSGEEEERRLEAIGTVLSTLDADLVGITEAPNTRKDGTESTTARLEAFAGAVGLRTTEAAMGYVSPGVQELAVLYDPSVISVRHDPGGEEGRRGNPPFDDEFFFDTDEDRISEVYRFYRPPLELDVSLNGTDRRFWLILVHPKSKGIFDFADMVHFEQESRRVRRKLFAECTWIRRRVDEWLDRDRDVVVMGDINDGPGMDYYEFQFARSAVEIVMGDLFDPDRVLRSYSGRPRWTKYGWKPASARFVDRLTEDPVNVLIDHILVSRGLEPTADNAHKIWNPYEDDDAREIRTALLRASDHFPITLDLL